MCPLIGVGVLGRRTVTCTYTHTGIKKAVAASMWILGAAVPFLSYVMLDWGDLGT